MEQDVAWLFEEDADLEELTRKALDKIVSGTVEQAIDFAEAVQQFGKEDPTGNRYNRLVSVSCMLQAYPEYKKRMTEVILHLRDNRRAEEAKGAK